MRRSVTAAVVALSTALSVSAAALSSPAVATATPTTTPGRAEAQHALSTAAAAVHGHAPHTDASMALLHLRLTMNALAPSDRRQAASILARPTSPNDSYGESYSVKAERKCAGHICIHWVPTTADAPPSKHWVDKNLKLMNRVWNYEVHKLGYDRPISDGTRGGGGSGKFDVYLKELTGQGLYGLTVAEQRTSYNKRLYTSYMLLDNDFKGYPSSRGTSLKVTAAHEFFHAIQYAYDVREDPWMMEATATWMEEQFDDPGNDNRQYLPYGQVRHPGDPLDKSTNFALYGNWLFFQYLSEHYGRGVVKSIWHHAAAFAGGGHQFSAQAIRSTLSSHGGMTPIFGRYANGNTVPGHTYPEGSAYPASPAAAKVTLSKTTRSTGWVTYQVKHLASADVRAFPGADLTGKAWRLKVAVNGPAAGKAPVAVVLVKRTHHPMTRTLVHLDRQGDGSAKVPFSTDRTASVTVTLANASTKYRCHRGTSFSCQGVPRAQHPAFLLRLSAVRR
jgi:hypothetical protein